MAARCRSSAKRNREPPPAGRCGVQPQAGEADRIAAQERAARAAARLKGGHIRPFFFCRAGLKRLPHGDSRSAQRAVPPDSKPCVTTQPSSSSWRHHGLDHRQRVGDGNRTPAKSPMAPDDLSKRTERQAAAPRGNRGGCRSRKSTANVANSTKRTGGRGPRRGGLRPSSHPVVEVVGQAEEAMRRIEDSSKQISNIIGVIDEIAFQTNLLALNCVSTGAAPGKPAGALRSWPRKCANSRNARQRCKEIKELITTRRPGFERR